MKFTNPVLAAFLLVATTPAVHSFTYTTKTTTNNLKSRTSAGRGAKALFLSPEELTNYMAKAHEEKIRAVKEVEAVKNAQIQTLKGEVTALKAAPKQSSSGVVLFSPPASGMDLSSMSKEELTERLLSYQQFMARYIVEAQQQKMKAVQAAEAASAAKYEGKLKLLLASSSSDSSTTSKIEAASSSPDTNLYETRSANVAAAAKAGKSRWGDKEVAKVKITSQGSDLDVKADSKNGAVNGANGSLPSVPSPISLPGSALYNERNEKVAAAGKAGKSRWGDAEVKKASVEASTYTLSSSTATTPPLPAAAVPTIVKTAEIEAADHGLRNDGGVGGPSLSERVNLGQQLFTGSDAAAAPSAAIAQVSVVPSVYDLRNAKIAAAAAAGKSRWGGMENTKATSLAAASKILSSGAASPAIAVVAEIAPSPEVEAADHGLRNDGGVGGPSLAERVNFGAGIL